MKHAQNLQDVSTGMAAFTESQNSVPWARRAIEEHIIRLLRNPALPRWAVDEAIFLCTMLKR